MSKNNPTINLIKMGVEMGDKEVIRTVGFKIKSGEEMFEWLGTRKAESIYELMLALVEKDSNQIVRWVYDHFEDLEWDYQCVGLIAYKVYDILYINDKDTFDYLLSLTHKMEIRNTLCRIAIKYSDLELLDHINNIENELSLKKSLPSFWKMVLYGSKFISGFGYSWLNELDETWESSEEVYNWYIDNVRWPQWDLDILLEQSDEFIKTVWVLLEEPTWGFTEDQKKLNDICS